MSSWASSYPGYASHPSLGEDAVTGEIRVEQRCIAFVTGEMRAEMPLHELTVSAGGDDGEYIVFEHPRAPEWAFWTFDRGIFEHPGLKSRADLRRQLSEVQIQQQGLPLAAKAAIGVVLFLLVLCVIAVTQSDRIIRAFVAQIPISWEQDLGESVIKEFREEAVFLTNQAELAYLNQLGAALQKGVGSTPYKFKFYFMEESEPNALALPGGHIIVTSGLIQQATRSEQVAGVLAHELAHVTERHGMRTVVESFGPLFAVQAVFRKDSALARLASISAYIGVQRYSREHEREADDKAFDYLARANIDPAGLIEFFKQDPKDLPGELEFLSSHPPTRERIARLEERLSKHPRKSGYVRLPPLPQKRE